MYIFRKKRAIEHVESMECGTSDPNIAEWMEDVQNSAVHSTKFKVRHFYLSPRRRPGRYCNAPRLSVCPSVTFSFRTVTQKHIAVFSQNFAGTCTMSWGYAV